MKATTVVKILDTFLITLIAGMLAVCILVIYGCILKAFPWYWAIVFALLACLYGRILFTWDKELENPPKTTNSDPSIRSDTP